MAKSKNNAKNILSGPVSSLTNLDKLNTRRSCLKQNRTIKVPLQGNTMHTMYNYSIGVATFLNVDGCIMFVLLVLAYGRNCTPAGSCSSGCSWRSKHCKNGFKKNMCLQQALGFSNTNLCLSIKFVYQMGNQTFVLIN